MTESRLPSQSLPWLLTSATNFNGVLCLTSDISSLGLVDPTGTIEEPVESTSSAHSHEQQDGIPPVDPPGYYQGDLNIINAGSTDNESDHGETSPNHTPAEEQPALEISKTVKVCGLVGYGYSLFLKRELALLNLVIC